MSEESWWEHYTDDPFLKVGNYVPDSFGNPVIVTLDLITWAYIDWYSETHGSDPSLYFQKLHVLCPEDLSFSDWIEDSVRNTYLREEREGRQRPPWCSEARPDEYQDVEIPLDN